MQVSFDLRVLLPISADRILSRSLTDGKAITCMPNPPEILLRQSNLREAFWRCRNRGPAPSLDSRCELGAGERLLKLSRSFFPRAFEGLETSLLTVEKD